MALTLGTNVGFVLTAPTADPAGSDTTIDGSSVVVKDTSPAGAIKITEIGWYRGSGTNTANFEVALYSEAAGVADARLYVDATNSSSSSGWIRTTVDWTITPSTAYWLGLQMDAHTGSSTVDSATSGGSGIDVRTSQTTLNDPYGGGAVSDADGMYAIYAKYQSAPTVALNSPADASSDSDTTPTLDFTGTDAQSDDVRYEVQVDTASLQDISIDNHTNSGEKTSVSSVTQSHTTGTLTNGAIFVRTMTRGGSTASLTISTVKYNGVDLSLIRSDQYSDADAGQLRTEIWGIKAPSSGANNVVVTFGGTVSFTVVDIITLDGVNQTNITEAVGGGNSINQSSPISNSATTVSKNAWLLDALYTKTADTLTKGANQTQDSQVSTNTAGDMTATSHQGPVASPGSTAMSWTYTNADDYAQSIVVVKPLIPLIDAVSGTDAGFANPDASPQLLDSYSESNSDDVGALGGSKSFQKVGQSFDSGTGGTLNSCKFYLDKDLSPTGNITAALYAHTGTYGTSSTGTGSALATSDNVDVSTLGTSAGLITFTFSGANKVTLAASTKYVIVVEYAGGDASNFVNVGADVSSPTHGGNLVTYAGSWGFEAAIDAAFYIYLDDVDPFNSGENIQYTVQSALSAGTYYWRVRGIDPTGSNTYGVWSSTRSFTITTDVTTTKTITGVGHITATTTRTVTGVARILQTVLQTITGKSRIQKSVAQVITGLARITATTLQTVTGKARITATTTQTTTGKARITQIVAQTIAGIARITVSTLRTVAGVARITASTTQTTTGKARITATALQLITGVARITKTVLQTISGVARITQSVAQTVTGKARLQKSVTQNATGVARITITSSQTINGKSRITATSTQTVTGVSRITQSVLQTITGKSRLTTSVLQVINGKAQMRATTAQTIGGKAKIFNPGHWHDKNNNEWQIDASGVWLTKVNGNWYTSNVTGWNTKNAVAWYEAN